MDNIGLRASKDIHKLRRRFDVIVAVFIDMELRISNPIRNNY